MPLVYYAPHRIASPAAFAMDYGGSTQAAVSAIAGAACWLEQAGWSISAAGSAFATAQFNFPSGVSPQAAAYCVIDGIAYLAVTGGSPGHPTLYGGTVTIPLGADSDDAVTANLFAAAVTLFSQWTATPTMTGAAAFTLGLVAKTAGPAANASVMTYNPAYCVLTTPPWGGADQWLSAASPNGSRLEVSLAAYLPGYEGATYLIVTTLFPGTTTPVVKSFNCSAGWNFWADDFSLALWMSGTVDQGIPNGLDFYYAGVAREVSIASNIEWPGVYSAFLHCDSAQTLIGANNASAADLFGTVSSYPATGPQSFALAAPASYAYEIDGKGAVDPTPPGLPLIIPARLGLACPPGTYHTPIDEWPSGQIFLLGQLYDGIVLTAQYALGATIGYNSLRWVCLLAQPGASLFVCTGAVAANSAVVPWTDETGTGGTPGSGGAGGPFPNYAF